MGHAAQQPLAPAPHQDHVVVLRELVQDHLEGQDAPTGFRVEPLHPGGPILGETGEAILGQAVALGPAEQLLLVDVRVAETVRDRHADLGPAAAHFLGDRENRHGFTLLPGSSEPGRTGRSVARA